MADSLLYVTARRHGAKLVTADPPWPLRSNLAQHPRR